MTQEALKLALEALEGMYIPNFTMDDSPINNAITAIKEALAQTQEPIRIIGFDCVCGRRMTVSAEQGVVPAPQRTWVKLMRGVRVEGDSVVISVKGGNEASRELCNELLKEKNT